MAERKKFIDVEIPLLASTMRVLGTPEELDKKTIKLDLSRKMRGKGMNVIFQIFNEKGKLSAFPKKIELVKSYIQRMMRKRIDYVEDSFNAQCRDIRARVKPFLITRKRVSRAVRKNLRNTAREFLQEYLKEKDYNEICEELLDGTLQKSMLPKLKKVYPLSFCDLRIFETAEIEKMNFETARREKIEEMEEDTEETKEVEEEKVAEEKSEEKDEKKETKEKKSEKKK